MNTSQLFANFTLLILLTVFFKPATVLTQPIAPQLDILTVEAGTPSGGSTKIGVKWKADVPPSTTIHRFLLKLTVKFDDGSTQTVSAAVLGAERKAIVFVQNKPLKTYDAKLEAFFTASTGGPAQSTSITENGTF